MDIDHDPDEWELVDTSQPCTTCDDNPSRCNGGCDGFFRSGLKRRPPEQVTAIKAKRRQEHEDVVLAEAEQIKARRAASPAQGFPS